MLELSKAPADTTASASSHVLRWTLFGLAALHFSLSCATGVRTEHVVADGLLALLPWGGPQGLALAESLLPLWLTGVVIDWQRYFPLLGRIHTGDTWHLDALLFPATLNGTRVPWPAWFDAHPKPVFDIVCGLAYALFIFEYFAIAIFFFFRDRLRVAPLGWAFFLVNVAGAVIYVLWPVAPPWYVLQHGMGPADLLAAPSAAGCARFDALLHTHYFASFYARNPNVFGAMPSLHVAYPLMAVWFTWHRGWYWRVPTALFCALVGFSAVYLAHHYVIDVLAGLAVASVSAWAAQRLPGLARRSLGEGNPRLRTESIHGVPSPPV